MSLLTEIRSNQSLFFIDDEQEGKKVPIRDMELIVPPGEVKQLAFLYIDNSLESVRILFSFLNSVHALALLSPSLPADFKTSLEQQYQPAFIYDKSNLSREQYTASSLHPDLLSHRQPVDCIIATQVKVLLSTSGTTGSPKFVKLSEENLLHNARSIASYLPISKEDITPLNLPVYYSYGLSVLTSNALCGGTIVCTNTDVLNRSFWQKMEDYGYTSIAGVPFVYEMLDRIGFTKKHYPSLRYMTQAGGKLQESLVQKYASYAREHQIRFYVMYGQTEATARMSYLPPEQVGTKTGSVGIPIPGGTFDIDADSSELKYKGPNIYGGYASSPEDLATFESPEWLATGDLARRDEDGYYYITGRLKRFIKLFGSRVNLDELEALIFQQLGTIVRCVAIEDKSLLLVTDQPDVDLEEAARYLSTTMKIHPSVIRKACVPAIPLSANGKPDYTAIISQYLNNDPK
jgi:long-chain acyl-CoA synthetase